MSMENAILEHASALRELGQAMKDAAMMNAEVAKLNGEMLLAQARQVGTVGNALTPETDLDKAVEAGAKTKADVKTAEKNEPIVEGSLGKALLKEKGFGKTEDENLIGADDKVLDYKADVVPPLLALDKKNKGLKALLTEFGVAKGDQLKPEQYPAIIARAIELAA